MPSRLPGVERAKPLLGTRVSVRAHGLAPETAQAAITSAFEEIAAVHALMSFHLPGSDISRLNREAHCVPVQVDPRTRTVLERALTLSRMSNGVFDVTVAPCLVARGLLPHPDAPSPDPTAIWRDIAICDDGCVQFRRPLWIDLGGIAKGFAVDRAMDVLLAFGPLQCSVNAGGDLRIAGPDSERVRLTPDDHHPRAVPLIEIADGSVASSCGRAAGRCWSRSCPHVDPLKGHALSPRRFVSVMAQRCMDADALTKIVMAQGQRAAAVLTQFAAKAVLFEAAAGWCEIGE